MEDKLNPKALTYGEKAVGINFNPANDPKVQKVKELYAEIIDLLNMSDGNEMTKEKDILLTEATRQAQTAQMWAVKFLTYPY